MALYILIKMEAINNMKLPTTQKGVRNFIGSVTYYQNVCIRRSHTLEPLTKLTSNRVRFKSAEVEQKAFKDINQIVAHNTLLAYPYFNKLFEIYTNASDFQLGVVIIQ